MFVFIIVTRSSGHAACVEKLLAYKANSNPTKDTGDTPLHCAYKYANVVSILLDHDKSSINAQNEDGMTPLILAAAYGCLETVQLYIKFGADTNVCSEEFGTALYAAKHSTDGQAAEVATLLQSLGAKNLGPNAEGTGEGAVTERFGYDCFDGPVAQT